MGHSFRSSGRGGFLHRLHDSLEWQCRTPSRLAECLGRGRFEDVQNDLVPGQEGGA